MSLLLRLLIVFSYLGAIWIFAHYDRILTYQNQSLILSLTTSIHIAVLMKYWSENHWISVLAGLLNYTLLPESLSLFAQLILTFALITVVLVTVWIYVCVISRSNENVILTSPPAAGFLVLYTVFIFALPTSLFLSMINSQLELKGFELLWDWLDQWSETLATTLAVVPLFIALPVVFNDALKSSLQKMLEPALIAALALVLWTSLFLYDAIKHPGFVLSPMLVLFLLLWAAARSGTGWTATLSSILSLSALAFTFSGLGPFAHQSTITATFRVESFVTLTMSITLIASAYISQSQRHEKKLRLLESAINGVSEGVVISEKSDDDPVVYCNRAFLDMTGYSREEIYGHNMRLLNRNHRQQSVLKEVRDCLNNGHTGTFVLRNQTKSGEDFFNRLSLSPIRATGGNKITHFCGIQNDCTQTVMQHQRLEQRVREKTKELQLQQDRLSLAIKVSGLGIWEWDLVENSLHWDANMHQIYRTPDEVIEAGVYYEFWRRTVHPEDVDYAAYSLEHAAQQAKEWQHEFRLLLDDGLIRYVRAAAAPVFDEQGKAIKMIGGNLDITHQREVEFKLREAAKNASLASKAKSEFLANMSHEIRTPLNGVLGISELLQATELTHQQQDYLNMITASAETLLSLLNDILDLSKIEAGAMTTEPYTINLDDQIGGVVKAFAFSAHSKGLELHYYIDPHLPASVLLDGVRLNQILFNLLGNAIKFTPEGEVTLYVDSLEPVKAYSNGFFLRIKVSDTGIGMDAETQQRVLNSFEQADSSITRQYGGSGLGLTIVKALVKLLDGQLTISSTPGKGSKFTVLLPSKTGQPASPPFDTKVAPPALQHALENCLIVDDNAINRRWLHDIILSWGGLATAVESAEQAFEILTSPAASNITMMFLDKNMPKKSGFDLMQALQKQNVHLPHVIIMLSSSEVAEDVHTAKALGINSYLVKPIKQSEVYDAIVNILPPDAPVAMPEPNGSGVTRTLTVLVAEDNPVNQRLVKDVLENRGHRIICVENGQEAVSIVRQQQFDVILMDVQMPVMDGYEATRQIRELETSASIQRNRIIGLTANALSSDRQQCLAVGMDDYLSKPVAASTLLFMLEQGSPLAAQSNTQQQSSATEAVANPLFDLDKSKKVTGNNMALIKQMARVALEHRASLLEDIRLTIKQGERQKAARHIHRMKGTVGNFCTTELLTALENVERNYDEWSIAELHSRWQETDDLLGQFFDELTLWVDKG
tara:strand:- start:15280 stop:18957 length:3678 start_codon:yes stop_codon:yes gene_type:complete